MLKKLVSIIVLTALTGCMWQTVNKFDIDAANKICTSLDSTVAEISSNWAGMEEVTCANGYVKSLHRTIQ